MASLRASAQSIAAYRSSSSQPLTPRTWPSELVAVWVRNPRAQLGAGADHLRDQHCGHQITVARGRGIDELRQAESLRGAQHRRDMPVRQAAGDLKRLG